MQDAYEAQPPVLFDSVVCRVRMMITDRVDAIVELDGTVSEIHDVRFRDLLGVLERAEVLSEQGLGHSNRASRDRRSP